MNTETILKASFFSGIIITIIGAYLKVTHAAGADTWLFIAIAMSVIFILVALYEILSSKNINASEKVLWTLGLVFFSTIAGLIYLLVSRKKIVDNP